VSYDVVKAKPDQRMLDDWVVGKLVVMAAGKRGNENTKKVLREEVDGLVVELAGPNPTAVESMLARTAAILWFSLRLHERRYGDWATSEEGMTIVQSDHLQRRIDRTHRRLMSTIKTLATVRRLAVPALQINVAR
jgi:hypothetical protein